MPRVEASLEPGVKDAFCRLARQSGTTEAALLRRMIVAVLATNRIAPTREVVEAGRSMRLTVRVTPDIFEAVTKTARTAGTTRPNIVLGTLRARFLAAPTLLPVEAEALSKAAYQLAMVGTNLNQLMRSIHQRRPESLAPSTPILQETAAAVGALRQHVHALMETATTRWAPAEDRK